MPNGRKLPEDPNDLMVQVRSSITMPTSLYNFLLEQSNVHYYGKAGVLRDSLAFYKSAIESGLVPKNDE